MQQWQESDLQKRSEIAQTQLEQWEAYGRNFPLVIDPDSAGTPMRCGFCGQSIYFISDTFGNSYSYTDEEELALTVAHIRQAHEEVDYDRSI